VAEHAQIDEAKRADHHRHADGVDRLEDRVAPQGLRHEDSETSALQPLQEPHRSPNDAKRANRRGLYRTALDLRNFGEPNARLPGDAVVLAEVARAAPQRAVRLVEVDRVDRARGAFPALEAISH